MLIVSMETYVHVCMNVCVCKPVCVWPLFGVEQQPRLSDAMCAAIPPYVTSPEGTNILPHQTASRHAFQSSNICHILYTHFAFSLFSQMCCSRIFRGVNSPLSVAYGAMFKFMLEIFQIIRNKVITSYICNRLDSITRICFLIKQRHPVVEHIFKSFCKYFSQSVYNHALYLKQLSVSISQSQAPKFSLYMISK